MAPAPIEMHTDLRKCSSKQVTSICVDGKYGAWEVEEGCRTGSIYRRGHPIGRSFLLATRVLPMLSCHLDVLQPIREGF